MLAAEYIVFSKYTAIRGVFIYQDEKDLELMRPRIISIYSFHRILPKKSHRNKIWDRIWMGKEKPNLHIYVVEKCLSLLIKEKIILVKKNFKVSVREIDNLLTLLDPINKEIFINFLQSQCFMPNSLLPGMD